MMYPNKEMIGDCTEDRKVSVSHKEDITCDGFRNYTTVWFPGYQSSPVNK